MLYWSWNEIKNNLNMVSALISFKESEITYDLSDIKSQIEAISLVHEKLYQHNKVDKIEVGEYFQSLLESIFSFSANRNVHIVNNVEAVSINTKRAISLGLLVNEIATNAIKYGFNQDEEAPGRFGLLLRKSLALEVSTSSNLLARFER
ncbi:MAG: sensor histidine kinase [Spirochaetales bacterium]|nr:sensor histidine kinase [Spirochaetales bacterium]